MIYKFIRSLFKKWISCPEKKKELEKDLGFLVMRTVY